jgi:hypothetical protein
MLAGRTWFDSWKGQGIILFSEVPRPALGPNQPIQSVLKAVFLGARLPHCGLVSRLRMHGFPYLNSPVGYHGIVLN